MVRTAGGDAGYTCPLQFANLLQHLIHKRALSAGTSAAYVRTLDATLRHCEAEAAPKLVRAHAALRADVNRRGAAVASLRARRRTLACGLWASLPWRTRLGLLAEAPLSLPLALADAYGRAED